MKGKQIAILLVLLVIIGGVAFFLQKRNQSEWTESATRSEAKILDFPINDVTRVVIQAPNGQVQLAKKNDVWVVEEKADYPANFERVSGLIRQLWELHPVQELKVGPSQFSRFELTEPGQGDNAGTVIELKDKGDKTLARIVAGKRDMQKGEGPRQFPMPAGRYVLAPQTGKVSLVSQMLETDVKPESWLKRDFVKIDNPSSIVVAGQTGPKHWTLTRTDAKAEWKLTDAKPNEELDKASTGSLATVLASPSFADVLPPDAKPDEHGLDKPETLTIQTFNGFSYTLKIGKAEGSNYPVRVSVTGNLARERTPAPDEKPEDKTKKDEEFKTQSKKLEEKAASEKELEKRIYLIPKSTLDPFLKDRAELMAKKTPPSPSPAAAPRKKR